MSSDDIEAASLVLFAGWYQLVVVVVVWSDASVARS